MLLISIIIEIDEIFPSPFLFYCKKLPLVLSPLLQGKNLKAYLSIISQRSLKNPRSAAVWRNSDNLVVGAHANLNLGNQFGYSLPPQLINR